MPRAARASPRLSRKSFLRKIPSPAHLLRRTRHDLPRADDISSSEAAPRPVVGDLCSPCEMARFFADESPVRPGLAHTDRSFQRGAARICTRGAPRLPAGENTSHAVRGFKSLSGRRASSCPLTAVSSNGLLSRPAAALCGRVVVVMALQRRVRRRARKKASVGQAPVGGALLMTYVPEPGPRLEQRAPRVEERSRPARPATPANNAA